MERMKVEYLRQVVQRHEITIDVEKWRELFGEEPNPGDMTVSPGQIEEYIAEARRSAKSMGDDPVLVLSDWDQWDILPESIGVEAQPEPLEEIEW